jgi:hypothetical protein
VANELKVVAAVLMADPRFTKGMPFNKGTAKNTGVRTPPLDSSHHANTYIAISASTQSGLQGVPKTDRIVLRR